MNVTDIPITALVLRHNPDALKPQASQVIVPPVVQPASPVQPDTPVAPVTPAAPVIPPADDPPFPPAQQENTGDAEQLPEAENIKALFGPDAWE